jgi:hypothetical protein
VLVIVNVDRAGSGTVLELVYGLHVGAWTCIFYLILHHLGTLF